MSRLTRVLISEGFECKETVSLTKKDGETSIFKNNLSTSLRSYEDLIEKGYIESFVVIPCSNNLEYDIYVRVKGKDQQEDRLNLA